MTILNLFFIISTWILTLIIPAAVCLINVHVLKLNEPQIIEASNEDLVKIEVLNISARASFILFQAHSQKTKLQMSYNPIIANNLPTSNATFIKGSNIGLVVMLELSSLSASVYVQSSEETKMLIIAQGYGDSDPIPGGCNMEFSMEVAPYLKLNYTSAITQVKYQRASFGHPRYSIQPHCDDSFESLTYDIFVYFFEKNKTSEETFFNSIKKMYNVSSIHHNALKITPTLQSSLHFEIPTYRRIGVIFNVITRTGNSSDKGTAAYIPIVSYGCRFEEDEDPCDITLTEFEWILMAFAAFIGLFLCVLGHRFFKISLFCHGFSATSLITYIILARFSSLSYINLVAVVFLIGVVCGIAWVVVWCLMGSPVLSVTLTGFNLGFLVASIAFFTPLGEFGIFTNDLNFWLTFSCIVIIVPIIFINFTQKLHIVGCAILGSYGIVLFLDRDMAGLLTYIILNVLRRAIVPSFKNVFLVVPFFTTDIALSCAWAFLAILGFVVQCIRERRRPPFPRSPIHTHPQQSSRRPRPSTSIARRPLWKSPSRNVAVTKDDDDEGVWNYSIPTAAVTTTTATAVASTPERQPLLGRSSSHTVEPKLRDYSSTRNERQPELPYA